MWDALATPLSNCHAASLLFDLNGAVRESRPRYGTDAPPSGWFRHSEELKEGVVRIAFSRGLARNQGFARKGVFLKRRFVIRLRFEPS